MYQTKLNLKETEIAIKKLKDTFEEKLAISLQLMRVSAPLFVDSKSGLNDNLNGTEIPVSFKAPSISNCEIEIVHSLAKWKRLALARYGFQANEGLYTDMNAIRKDETIDHLHSLYVDQWDWEKIIIEDNRTKDYLEEIVKKIVLVLYETQAIIRRDFPVLEAYVSQDVYFITTRELERRYPQLTPKERENAICKEHGVVFVEEIGWPLQNGMPHDGRAPDYDDWSLNGDLLVYHPLIAQAVEISSMGIRVNKEVLLRQLEAKDALDRLDYPYHKSIINGEIPLTIGGGIGQSRIAMLLLNKVHIGEVQASLWSEDIYEECYKQNVRLL